jgi:hypothetical protein
LKKKTIATTLRLFEPAWNFFKTTVENDNAEKFNIVEFFDKDNRVINENILNSNVTLDIGSISFPNNTN